MEYLYQNINNISPPEILQSFMDRFLYMLNEGDKIHDKKGTKAKGHKSLQFKETGDLRYIYQNELNKVFFPHDMA